MSNQNQLTLSAGQGYIQAVRIGQECAAWIFFCWLGHTHERQNNDHAFASLKAINRINI